MRVGVTGGAGFIGGWVCEELARTGHEVIVFDHLDRPSQYKRMLGDVRDPGAMLSLGGVVDGIIHLAAVLGTQETIRYPNHAVRTNIEAGLNLLEVVDRFSIPAVNICVGNYWMQNPYSISKTTVERLCVMARDETGARINQVRCVNAYGPRQGAPAPFGSAKVRKIVPTFTCQALSSQPVEVYGDGSQISDCVWAGDVAEVLVLALVAAAKGDVFDEVIEVGPVAHHRVGEVAELVVDAADSSAGIRHLPMRPGETVGTPVTADTSSLDLLGVDPKKFKHLDEGIAETVDWFRSVEGRLWQRC